MAILLSGEPRARLWGAGLASAVVGVLALLLSVLLFLAVVYVIAYVGSAAWHDAKNVRRR